MNNNINMNTFFDKKNNIKNYITFCHKFIFSIVSYNGAILFIQMYIMYITKQHYIDFTMHKLNV